MDLLLINTYILGELNVIARRPVAMSFTSCSTNHNSEKQ